MALDVTLPDVGFDIARYDTNSTRNAAHSQTPTEVSYWPDFRSMVDRALTQEVFAATTLPVDLKVYATNVTVEKEQDITHLVHTMLNNAVGVPLGFDIREGSKRLKGNPDMTSVPAETPSTSRQTRSGKTKYAVPIETKTWWKFSVPPCRKVVHGRWQPGDAIVDASATSGSGLVSLWQLGSSALDKERNNEKKTERETNVWHTLRQVLGQMVTDQLSFGVLQTYRQWWFLRREGKSLFISDCFDWKATTPSALQAYAALLLHAKAYVDATVTPVPFSTERRGKRRRESDSGGSEEEQEGRQSAPKKKGKKALTFKANTRGRRGCGDACMTEGEGMAFEEVDLVACSLLAETRLKVFASDCGRAVIKVADPQRFAEHKELVKEMENEQAIYWHLATQGCSSVAPRFIGFGLVDFATCLCVEREGPSFEELGLENVSLALRRSALAQLRRLHAHGQVEHGDLRLGNVVCSRREGGQAKLIDFGHSRILRSGQKKKRFADEEAAFAGLLFLQGPCVHDSD